MGGKCFVFPNRRAMVFFRKYLSEAVAADPCSVPSFAPDMMTISDFFCRTGTARIADRVTLLLRLYSCYSKLSPKAEPLDEFIFWGDVILGDFNDVDKYLVDPVRIFTNVADFRQIQDSYSYLTETQRKAIEGFVSHFNDRSGRLTVDIGSDNPGVKARFLQIWNILGPLYELYGNTLSGEGIAYEGMVYRRLAERLDDEPVSSVLAGCFPGTESFVFVGLNALNECEKKVLRRMRDAGVAQFCWDYSGNIISDPHNKSSFFMRENVREFPQAYEWDPDGTALPEINVVSVPSSVGQVKQIPNIFRRIADEAAGGDLSRVGGLGTSGSDCAVVLPDENLLVPLLNTVPPEIRDINVTMGYPMSGSAFFTFMRKVSALQLHSRERGGEYSFYYRQVWDLFADPVFMKVADVEGRERISEVKAAAKIYIPAGDLAGPGLFSLLFSPVVRDQKTASSGQIAAIAEYQKSLVTEVAALLRNDDAYRIETEFAKEYYSGVVRLMAASLSVLPMTYFRLLEQLLAPVSVPFRGEPLKGLQVMGPLETRALDFSNVIILSCNEGIFPRKSVSSSFVPPELRRGFGLPTYEYQDAVWAYYFYRMITRASRVWLLYDSRTEGLRTGEESRYIKQLSYHFRLPLRRFVTEAAAGISDMAQDIVKTQEDVEIVRSLAFSASAIQSYLSCPAQFYYSRVRKLAPEAEVSESLDAGMFGNVFHNVMWALYSGDEAMAADFVTDKTRPDSGLVAPLGEVSAGYIRKWLGRRADIRAKVMRLISEELNGADVTGRNLVVADVIVKYVMKTLERDLELLSSRGIPSFRIVGLEKRMSADFGGYRFVGYLDRLDSLSDGTVRVVDYKTGKVQDNEMAVTDSTAERVLELIFGEDNSRRPKIALQFFVYDMLLRMNGYSCGIENSVYSTVKLFSGPVEVSPLSESFYSGMSERLRPLLDEIADPDVPFRRTADLHTCSYCDFKMICGR